MPNSYAIETFNDGPNRHATLYDFDGTRALTVVVRFADVDFLADPDAAKAAAVATWRSVRAYMLSQSYEDVGPTDPYVAAVQTDFLTDEYLIKVTNRPTTGRMQQPRDVAVSQTIGTVGPGSSVVGVRL
jgi:hypothetical protein